MFASSWSRAHKCVIKNTYFNPFGLYKVLFTYYFLLLFTSFTLKHHNDFFLQVKKNTIKNIFRFSATVNIERQLKLSKKVWTWAYRQYLQDREYVHMCLTIPTGTLTCPRVPGNTSTGPWICQHVPDNTYRTVNLPMCSWQY